MKRFISLSLVFFIMLVVVQFFPWPSNDPEEVYGKATQLHFMNRGQSFLGLRLHFSRDISSFVLQDSFRYGRICSAYHNEQDIFTASKKNNELGKVLAPEVASYRVILETKHSLYERCDTVPSVIHAPIILYSGGSKIDQIITIDIEHISIFGGSAKKTMFL